MSVKKQSVAYVIPYEISDSHREGHRFGVNSLLLDSRGERLFSAGRDSTIRCWNAKDENPHCLYKLNEHTDWVNDIFLCSDDKTLVSCSNDNTVRFWNTSPDADAFVSNIPSIASLRAHGDYVKCLAYSPHRNWFASGGLDANICLWDVERTLSSYTTTATAAAAPAPIREMINTTTAGDASAAAAPSLPSTSSSSSIVQTHPSVYFPTKLVGHKESIYSMAINKPGTVLVSGSTERVLRVWDTRTCKKMFKLRGHKDNVRCLLINDDGTTVISGSSDKTIKVWDLRMQRAMQTYNVHSDSVWSLCNANHDDSTIDWIISAGKDKNIVLIDIKKNECCHLFQLNEPILKIVLSPDHSCLWAATSDSAITKWEYSAQLAKKIKENSFQAITPLTCFTPPSHSSSYMQLLHKQKLSSPANSPSKHHHHQQQRQHQNYDVPSVVIKGRPGIIKYHILNNRRHVLTQDTEGRVVLWDVTTGRIIRDFGKDYNKDTTTTVGHVAHGSTSAIAGTSTLFDEKVKELFEMVSVMNWLSIDTKFGCLTVHLINPQCFNAEVYAVDAGFTGENISDEFKVNIGECVIRGLFSDWRFKREKILRDRKRRAAQEQKLLKQQKQQQQHASNGTATATDLNISGETKQPQPQPQQDMTKPKVEGEATPQQPSSTNGASTNTDEEQDEENYDEEDQEQNHDDTSSDVQTDGDSSNDDDSDLEERKNAETRYQFPPNTEVIIKYEDSFSPFLCPFKKELAAFDGNEVEGKVIPRWIVATLLNGVDPQVSSQFTNSQKISFFLVSDNENDLPNMKQANAKLKAHRILRVKKICSHVVEQLQLELPLKRDFDIMKTKSKHYIPPPRPQNQQQQQQQQQPQPQPPHEPEPMDEDSSPSSESSLGSSSSAATDNLQQQQQQQLASTPTSTSSRSSRIGQFIRKGFRLHGGRKNSDSSTSTSSSAAGSSDAGAAAAAESQQTPVTTATASSATATQQRATTAEPRIEPEEYIEILCDGKVLNPGVNLATINAFFPKTGAQGSLKLTYRRKYPDLKI